MRNRLTKVVAALVGTAVIATLSLTAAAPAEAAAAWAAPAKGSKLTFAVKANAEWSVTESKGQLTLMPIAFVEPPTSYAGSLSADSYLMLSVALQAPTAGLSFSGHDDAAATSKFLKATTSADGYIATLGAKPSAVKTAVLPAAFGGYKYSYVTATSVVGGQRLSFFVGVRVFTALNKALFVEGTSTGTAAQVTASVKAGLGQFVLLKSGKALASKPVVTGTLVPGGTVVAYPGSGLPAGYKTAYQWYADGKAIRGATKSSLKLTPAQAGKRLIVKVTGKKAHQKTYQATSAATSKVDIPYFSSADLDKIASGTAYQGTYPADPSQATGRTVAGSVVTATAPAIKGATLSYQWASYDASTDTETLIKPKATGTTFTPSDAYVGKSVFVVVTVTKPGYHPAVVESNNDVEVVAAPQP